MKKQTTSFCAKTLKSIATIESICNLNLSATVLFLLFAAFFTETSAATLDGGTPNTIDSTFNTQITTTSYNPKAVNIIIPLVDGKILVSGRFSSYNGTPTGAIVRLNADGTLDTTFNDSLFSPAAGDGIFSIAVQSDGKILVGGKFVLKGETAARSLIRLNHNGSLDASFAYNTPPNPQFYGISKVAVRPNGKILLCGDIWALPGGNKAVVQLNSDGTFDNSFNFASNFAARDVAVQGGKILVAHSPGGTNPDIFRLNDDGDVDSSFTRYTSNLRRFFVQPSGKIVLLQQSEPHLQRLNEEGTADVTFQTLTSYSLQVGLQDNGNIAIYDSNSVKRLLPNGAIDTSFAAYAPNALVNSIAAQSDGKIIIGDLVFGFNSFLRLNTDGSVDTSFNTGTGFQVLSAGRVRTIAVQPDNKILIGGKFDLVGNVNRTGAARLNANGTLDTTFQLALSGTNRFTQIVEIYNLVLQSDGKIIVSGNFAYNLNGASKTDLARLNPDGSLDTTFNLNIVIANYATINGAGTNKVLNLENGKLLIGTSRIINTELPVPIKLNANGSRDTAFNSALIAGVNVVYIYDIFIQPDGKIICGGSYNVGGFLKSFVTRLNSDGSLDSSFQFAEETDKTVKSVIPLPDGKIVAAKVYSPTTSTFRGELVRLNSDGSVDSTFNAGTGANGKINVVLRLADGKFLVGGAFSQFNDQPRQNLAVLNEDGSLDSTLFNVDQEVFCLTMDNQGRVLVGGAFTFISNGGNSLSRTYLARLTDSSISVNRTRFDYDGDGRADVSVFRPGNSTWYLNQSVAGFAAIGFGASGDKPAPADFDGDGKTDVSVFRPSNGTWYRINSLNNQFAAVQFGANGDIPVPADYDGDGLDDVAVFRPTNGTWYRINSRDNQFVAVQFGQSGDKPQIGDFDGDGKSDIAVFRPASGTWYALMSSNNSFYAVQFGVSDDLPVSGDFDGDGKSDIAVFRPSNGSWYRLNSSNNQFVAAQFGVNGDVPSAADFDGDGKTDIAVFRPSNGTWNLLRSTAGFNALQFGSNGDVPTPTAFGQ